MEPKWDTHPALIRRPSRVSRSNSSAAAYQPRDFRYQSPSPGPKASTAPCTPGTPGISPVMSRATSISNNVSDQIPQVSFFEKEEKEMEIEKWKSQLNSFRI